MMSMIHQSKLEEDKYAKYIRGYYHLEKMAGRTKHGIYYNHPNPNDNRFVYRENSNYMKSRNNKLLNFEIMGERYKSTNRKPQKNMPIYEPKYDLILRSVPSAPNFRISSGRKEVKKEEYCSNTYEIQKEDIERMSPKKR